MYDVHPTYNPNGNSHYIQTITLYIGCPDTCMCVVPTMKIKLHPSGLVACVLGFVITYCCVYVRKGVHPLCT